MSTPLCLECGRALVGDHRKCREIQAERNVDLVGQPTMEENIKTRKEQLEIPDVTV